MPTAFALVTALLVGAPSTGKPIRVPKVVFGPALSATAEPVDAPIRAVTVFSDRARVRREGRAASKAGPRALRLPDLPGGVLLDTIRVSAKGARVLRVETAPVERDRRSIAQVEEQLDALQVLQAAQARGQGRRAVLDAELGMLRALGLKPPVAEHERRGRRPELRLAEVTRVLSFLEARQADLAARQRRIDWEIEKRAAEMGQLRRDIADFDPSAFSSRTVQVIAVVEATGGGRPTISLEYFVPGASWLPAYKVEMGKRGRVTIRTTGLVQQATGEVWRDVALSLSTSIPGQGIELPELLTWTLGESRDFTPITRARVAHQAPRLAAPSPRPTGEELEREASINALRQRLSDARRGEGTNRGKKRSAEKRKRRRAAPPPPPARRRSAAPPARPQMAPPAPPMEPSPVMMESADEGDDYADSTAMRVSSGASAPPGVSRTPLNLFESVTRRAPRFSDQRLPAVVAGGLDYVYPATTRVTVPSSARRHQVPLAVETYPAETFYELSPGVSTVAYLKAQVTNGGSRPLLGGQVDIFAGADFVGTGTLATTGPGGTLSLPLGADEDLRVVRKVLPQTVTEGVFSKEDLTRYRTVVEVANYKSRAVTVRLTEVLPKGSHEDVVVKLGKVSPKPEGPDAEGMLVFKLALKPGEKQVVSFDYTIRRPAGWQLRQH
jgi:hypothetical protein